MSEQDQTEKQGGSVVLPTVVAAGAGFGTKKLYDKAANQLASAALNPGGVATDAKKAEQAVIDAAAKIENAAGQKNQLISARVLQNDEIAKNVTEIGIDKVKAGDATTHTITTVQANGEKATLTGIKKLDGNVAKILEGKTGPHTLTADELKATKEASWLQKTGRTAETDVLKTVRAAKEYKDVAGVKAAFGHMSGGGKALVGAAAVLTVTSAGIAVKNLFSGKHTDQVAVDRSATPDQAAAR